MFAKIRKICVLRGEVDMESTFLVVNPSAFRGTARSLDLWAQLDDYNTSESGSEADAMAAYVDAMALKGDFDTAIQKLESEEDLETE